MLLGWKRQRRITSIILALPVAFIVTMFMLSRKNNSDVLISLQHQNLYKDYEDRKGIQVVVGHYVGNDIFGDTVPPVTREQLNRNYYSPVSGAGEMGEPVQISPLESGKMRQFYQINKFNLLASDRILVNRSLPDVRRKECKEIAYNISELPTTSIIIVFHNEAWSTLLRTVHSVINRSPRQLLKEIILVDDASDREFLKDALDSYVSRLPVPVTVLHIEQRVGLIRARLQGAAMSTGDVLTFLDAHCECTTGWLLPLLSRIAQNRSNVVCPIIDIINDDTFAYVKSFEMHWGAINWDMHFRWFAIGDSTMKLRHHDITSPFKSPVMAGGLFAIDKSYFYEIGTYDNQMDIWGGENIELSFRVWQCGGTVEIIPCSHVGHVFRKASPYTFPRPGGIASVLFANLARVAEVWMDDWKEFFFKLHPEAEKLRHNINVTDRSTLREKLRCKSFGWYLENIWTEHFFPTDNSFLGKFQNAGSGECLRRPKSKTGLNQATGNAITAPCIHGIVSTVLFVISPLGYIMSDESVCLDVPDTETNQPKAYFLACTRVARQRWKYNTENELLIHEQSGLCLDLATATGLGKERELILGQCSNHKTQKWKFQQFSWKRKS